MFKGMSGLTALLLMTLLSGEAGPIHQTSRVIGAVADISDATAAAAISAINASNAMATAATTWVAAAASNGLTAGDNLWRGVDLTNIEASRCGDAIVADSVEVLHKWLDSDLARAHFPCLSEPLSQRILAAALTLQDALPYTQSMAEDFLLTRSFTSLKVSAQQLEHHRIRVAFQATTLHYQVRWANPMWDGVGWSVELERTRPDFAHVATFVD